MPAKFHNSIYNGFEKNEVFSAWPLATPFFPRCKLDILLFFSPCNLLIYMSSSLKKNQHQVYDTVCCKSKFENCLSLGFITTGHQKGYFLLICTFKIVILLQVWCYAPGLFPNAEQWFCWNKLPSSYSFELNMYQDFILFI